MRAAMIRRAVVVLLAVLIPCGCTSQKSGNDWADHMQGLPFVVGYEAGLEQARSEAKPAMMFVTTTGCGACKAMAADCFTDPEIRKLLGNFVCVIVDGDKEGDALLQLNATQGYPTIVFLSPNGREIGRCLGYTPPDEFKAVIESALAAEHAASE